MPACSSCLFGLRFIHWRQFEPEVILLAVGWYLRFSLSHRDVEELLAERGLLVDHVTVWRWVQRLRAINRRVCASQAFSFILGSLAYNRRLQVIHMIRKGQGCSSVGLLHHFILGLFAATN
jgi:hypothetical protein